MTFQVPSSTYKQVVGEMLDDADIAWVAEPEGILRVTAAYGRFVWFRFNEDGSLRDIDAGDPDDT